MRPSQEWAAHLFRRHALAVRRAIFKARDRAVAMALYNREQFAFNRKVVEPAIRALFFRVAGEAVGAGVLTAEALDRARATMHLHWEEGR